jgi:VWFA-related protein
MMVSKLENDTLQKLFYFIGGCVSFAVVLAALSVTGTAQPERQKIRTMSIPISIFTKKELKEGQAEEFLQVDRLIVRENKQEQTILSIRSITDAPLSLAILIQDGLSSNVNLQLGELREFVKQLPKGSRVMVGYLRGGSMQIRQKFTTDLEKASTAFRIVNSSDAGASRNPYDGVIDALDRFDALPAGRRAILLVSDGLDVSGGTQTFSSLQSIDLDRAILRAQRKNVAVFSFYSPTDLTESGNGPVVLSAQGMLAKLSDETGGRAFFQGSIAPISFNPFFRELKLLLNRQFLLSYLTGNMKKAYYKIEVTSTNPEVKIEHPRGYYYR